MVRPAAPDRIREIAEEVARRVREELGPDARVLWFGSWARGDAVERSDIDVAFDIGRPLASADRARLDGSMEEIPTLYSIDLVDLRTVGSEFRERILEEGVDL